MVIQFNKTRTHLRILRTLHAFIWMKSQDLINGTRYLKNTDGCGWGIEGVKGGNCEEQ